MLLVVLLHGVLCALFVCVFLQEAKTDIKVKIELKKNITILSKLWWMA